MPLLDSEEDQVFDIDLAQKTFALQSLFEITADSKIGKETYLLMNEILAPEQTPVLRQRFDRS